MIVAVISVGMMEMAAHQIVHMAAVRHGLVPAAWTVLVRSSVPTAAMVGGARVRIRLADRDRVILDPLALLVLEMSVIEVVSVALVLDRGVAAAGAVHVRGGSSHGGLLLRP
jgi:hypothetical protein